MRGSGKTSLKKKLTISAGLLALLVAGALSYHIRAGQKKAVVERMEANRLDTLKALRQVAREAILVDDDTDMVNYVNLLKRSQTTAYAMVLYPDGRVRVHTDPLLIGKTLSDEPAQKALAHRARQTPLTQRLSSDDGRPVLDLSIPVVIGVDPGEFKGTARIGFDQKASDMILREALQEVDRRIIAAFGVALVIGLVGAYLLALLITRPIGILRRGAQRIGEGKLDHRIVVNTRDELRELADEFNLMAQKLGELDQMKQDFVSNVTHELRSPITSIRGYIDLLLQGAGGSLTELQADYLSVIKNSTVRLGRFIDNLLDVAKIEAHKLRLSPESQHLFPLAHEMEVLFKPQMDEKKIRFVNAVPKNLPPAFADKDKLAEVLINLTSNAIKFTPDNGEIRLSAVEGPNYLEMSLQDSGVGIPKDAAAKLFNKFEQVKSSQGLARKQKGTGLGLTIAKGIIEAHGGKIWVESPPPAGQGTVFHFTVPKLTDELKAKLSARSA